ncbi:hypothetical protein K1X76_12250 [bacterium]|nr:hypothetical protein [bacterium]
MKILFLIVCLLFPLTGFSGYSDQLPQPPEENPHPPVTEADKHRVAFAEKVIAALLQQNLPPGDLLPGDFLYRPEYLFKVDENCLASIDCLKSQKNLLGYIQTVKTEYGTPLEIKNTHIIPWSWDKYQHDKQGKSNTSASLSVPAGGSLKMDQSESAKSVRPAPVQMPDEFMMHAYVKFRENYWYHVDIFVSEDEKGNLSFRRFFILMMQNPMPPGVMC